MLEQFAKWMCQNTQLSQSSVYKYKRAVNTISNDMMEVDIIHKSLFDMSRFELDIAINVIFQNSQFIAKNEKGKRMYSNSLKQYRYFVADSIDEFDLEDDSLSTEKVILTKLRIGQGAYRSGLIAKYNGKCVVTGINHPKLLIASHIKPWSVCESNERINIENGLLLSANMDKLFDCGLITFNNAGKLAISSFVGRKNEEKLHLSNDICVDLKASNQLLNYLEYHRDVLFVR
ncbi:HNH endonuclease [Anaerotignum propionicum]|uniref:HNH endonuclease n=1 Tax=Anaerotignum propionicum TaxID=28446 RepID=UPI0028A00ABA|nr:HNH endonuclease [Anaerotignum propionicum]